jgi:hypothetical protein
VAQFFFDGDRIRVTCRDLFDRLRGFFVQCRRKFGIAVIVAVTS